jgi:hypothetical protein
MTSSTPLWLQIFRILRDGWMKLSLAMGFVMSRILLTILWILGFGFYAVAQKVISPFAKKKTQKDSYWIDTEPDFENSMSRQF